MDALLADTKNVRKETTAFQEKTEARLEEEPTSVDMEPEVAHHEVRKTPQ
jgi:hypothetical protein